MKTLIISSSRNPNSLSFKVCKEMEAVLRKKGVDVDFVDLKEMEVNFAFQDKTKDQKKIQQLAEVADNYIFGTPIYNYSISDSLKAVLDTCFPGREHKLFGIVAAAGGEKSYLSTMHLMQMCMKEWRMIPLPRTVYVTKKDFAEDGNLGKDLCDRVLQFSNDFYEVGGKLIG